MRAGTPYFVACRPCGHVWTLFCVPIEVSKAARIMKKAYCPRCTAGARGIVTANPEQIEASRRNNQERA